MDIKVLASEGLAIEGAAAAISAHIVLNIALVIYIRRCSSYRVIVWYPDCPFLAKLRDLVAHFNEDPSNNLLFLQVDSKPFARFAYSSRSERALNTVWIYFANFMRVEYQTRFILKWASCKLIIWQLRDVFFWVVIDSLCSIA